MMEKEFEVYGEKELFYFLKVDRMKISGD